MVVGAKLVLLGLGGIFARMGGVAGEMEAEHQHLEPWFNALSVVCLVVGGFLS